jgi:hypothetical protein
MKYLYLSSIAAGLVLGSVPASAAEPACSVKTLQGTYFGAHEGFNDKDLGYSPAGFAAAAFYDGKGGTVFTAINADKTEVTLKGTYKINGNCRGEASYSVKDDIRTVAFFVAPSGDEFFLVETGGPAQSHADQGRIIAGDSKRVSRENLVGAVP